MELYCINYHLINSIERAWKDESSCCVLIFEVFDKLSAKNFVVHLLVHVRDNRYFLHDFILLI